jgi:hypothetical protein
MVEVVPEGRIQAGPCVRDGRLAVLVTMEAPDGLRGFVLSTHEAAGFIRSLREALCGLDEF